MDSTAVEGLMTEYEHSRTMATGTSCSAAQGNKCGLVTEYESDWVAVPHSAAPAASDLEVIVEPLAGSTEDYPAVRRIPAQNWGLGAGSDRILSMTVPPQ